MNHNHKDATAPLFKPAASSRLARSSGSALITVLMFCFVGSVMLASILIWAKNQGNISLRQYEFQRAQYAAEAGAEKAIALMRYNLNSTGQAPDQSDINVFMASAVPSSSDSSLFANYRFKNIGNTNDRISIAISGSSSTQTITSGTSAGLNALIVPYRITSRVTTTNRPVTLTTGIQRDVQIQSIPIFQFAIFYNLDMEIENGPSMTVNGKVHSNKSLYIAPDSSLTFQDNVTLVQNLYNNPMSGDTHKTSWIAPTYSTAPVSGASSLNMPINTTNPHDLIEVPPSSGTDPISTDRLYNQAGLIIRISSTGSITVKDGAGSNVSGITVANGRISTNKTIYNHREGKTIRFTDIDVGSIKGANKLPANGILYVVDERTGSQENAIRLINGDTLPSKGLTVVTQNPLYIQGNYNSASDSPAAIFADSVNILSGSWNDANAANSGSALSSRIASSTTVEAALFTGIVPTSGGNYSGGVENLPRFLEDWSSATFTYTGSMVVMFQSETATGIWANASYSPPTRNWSFDTQFLNATRLPPGTPSFRTMSRVAWAITT